MKLPTITFSILITFSVSVHAQPSCGDPPRVDDQVLKGDVEGKAKFLSSLIGDANLKGQIEAARTDIFSKYPNAGTTRSDAYLQYMFCSFVLSDPKLPTQEKFRAIQEYRQVSLQSPAPDISTKGAQSPAVRSQGDTNIGYGAAPPPSPGSTPSATAPRQSSSAGSISTEGNQSPAVSSGGNVGIQYGAPPPAPSGAK